MGGKQWTAVAGSVVGDLHIKKNLPNQDAIAFYRLPGSSSVLVMAVSDGHGSEKCPRSDIGSALAVNTAVKVFMDSWSLMKSRLDESEAVDRPSTLANIERHIRKDITKQLVDNWISAVDAHSASVPFQAEQAQANRLLAYGATLTIVFLCEHFSACMRLGDCEVLIVDRDSKVGRIAPRNKEQVGEDTDSLCMPNADKRFSVSFQGSDDVSLDGNQLYLICSDGYEKAFESNTGFEQSAIDFAKLVSSGKGRETIEQEMESWLREYSNYSGDDVSVGLLFGKPQLPESAVPEKAVEILELGNLSAATDAAFKEDYVANDDTLAKFERFNPPETNDKP
jgi:hypothetical protein